MSFSGILNLTKFAVSCAWKTLSCALPTAILLNSNALLLVWEQKWCASTVSIKNTWNGLLRLSNSMLMMSFGPRTIKPIQECPCGDDCSSGCQGCENPICESKKAVLLLSTLDSRNVPMVIDFEGKELTKGYIDVGDGYWRRNVLVRTMRCWWQFWPSWSPKSTIFSHKRWGSTLKKVINVEILSPTFKNRPQL